MRAVWSDQHKYELWLRIEVLACEAWASLGRIPESALPKIRKGTFDATKIAEVESRVGHGRGAVGPHATIDPRVEEHVCRELGLKVDEVSPQVVSRDRHAGFMSALAIAAGTLERIAIEIRHLQRTEVGEAFEPFGKEQKGSSAMPHKRNPVLTERVCGLARVVRGNLLTALENTSLWHESDISHY